MSAASRAAQAGEPYEPEPYTPENATTIQLPWCYTPDADCPAILDFLGEVQARDTSEQTDAMVEFLFEVIGYTLLPRGPVRKAVLHLGPTGAGKSILLHLHTALTGEHQVSTESLTNIGSNRFSAANLVGKLANICADIGTQAAEDSSIFKAIVGGDRIPAERKGRQGFSFRPSATLIFSANEVPGSRDTGDAYTGRWFVIQYRHQFEEDARKEAELRALASDQGEMEGFMRHSVLGAGRMLDRGDFEVPADVAEAGERFRRTVDSVAGWLESDRTIVDDGSNAERKAAYASYCAWCEDEGKHPLGRTRFYDRLRQDRRIDEQTTQGTRYFENLRLMPVEGSQEGLAEAARLHHASGG